MTKEEIAKEISGGNAVVGIEFGSTRIKAVMIDSANEPVAGGAFDWENSLVDGVWTYSLDNVKKEKRFEMYLEGTRFADLVRWGDAATVLKDQGKYVPSFVDNFATTGIHKAELVTDPAITNYNTVYGFKAGKNERMPFPFSEIQKNENMKQNPGWN